jgi:hypothetical protein
MTRSILQGGEANPHNRSRAGSMFVPRCSRSLGLAGAGRRMRLGSPGSMAMIAGLTPMRFRSRTISHRWLGEYCEFDGVVLDQLRVGHCAHLRPSASQAEPLWRPLSSSQGLQLAAKKSPAAARHLLQP